MSEKMQPPSFAGASPFLLLRYVAVAPLMAPQLVCPSLSCADLNKRLIYSSPLDCRHLYHLSPRKLSVFRTRSCTTIRYYPLVPSYTMTKRVRKAVTQNSRPESTTLAVGRNSQSGTWCNMGIHVQNAAVHVIRSYSTTLGTLVVGRRYERYEKWKIKIFAHKVSWRAFALQTSLWGGISSVLCFGGRLCKTEFKRKSIVPRRFMVVSEFLEAEATQAPIIISN